MLNEQLLIIFNLFGGEEGGEEMANEKLPHHIDVCRSQALIFLMFPLGIQFHCQFVCTTKNRLLVVEREMSAIRPVIIGWPLGQLIRSVYLHWHTFNSIQQFMVRLLPFPFVFISFKRFVFNSRKEGEN